MVPTLVENSKFSVYLFVNFFFVNIIIMTGELMHTASEMAPHASIISDQLLSEK